MTKHVSMHPSGKYYHPGVSSRHILRPAYRTARFFTDGNLARPRQLGLAGSLRWLDTIRLFVPCVPPSLALRRTTPPDRSASIARFPILQAFSSARSLRHLRCRRSSIWGSRAPLMRCTTVGAPPPLRVGPWGDLSPRQCSARPLWHPLPLLRHLLVMAFARGLRSGRACPISLHFMVPNIVVNW